MKAHEAGAGCGCVQEAASEGPLESLLRKLSRSAVGPDGVAHTSRILRCMRSSTIAYMARGSHVCATRRTWMMRRDKRLAVAVLICSFLAVWQAPAFGKGFAGVRSFNVGTSPRSVAVGDFNGDGKPDMVVASFSSNTVSVLLGNGDGPSRQRQASAREPARRQPAISTVTASGRNRSPRLTSVSFGDKHSYFSIDLKTQHPSSTYPKGERWSRTREAA